MSKRLERVVDELLLRYGRHLPKICWALKHSRDRRRIVLAEQINAFVSLIVNSEHSYPWALGFLKVLLDNWERNCGPPDRGCRVYRETEGAA